MSNQPIPPAPGYWAPPNHNQQWTSHPSSSGSVPPTIPFNLNMASLPHNINNNLESYYTNPNLQAFGGPGATGSLPPHPFAFPGAFPPPPPPPPQFPTIPNLGYPLMPLPPAPAQIPPSRPSTNDIVYSAQSDALESRPMTTTGSKSDLDREEGELTDIEGPVATESRHDGGSRRAGGTFGRHDSHVGRREGEQTQNKFPNAPGVSRQPGITAMDRRRSVLSEREEGEASPEPRHCNRESGSPYNPPMPADTESPSTRTSGDLTDMSISLPTSTESQASSQSSKSLPQLRVQAQGAILSLAPHNIRYNELVGEGINPTVLRQLYEEVGIKVPSTPPAEPVTNQNDNSATGPSVVNGQATQLGSQPGTQADSTQKPVSSEPSSLSAQPTPIKTTKPMERKEVIARMLAAKAAKKSPASVPPQTDAAPVTSNSAETVEKSVTSTVSEDLAAKEKDSRAKEKNKAQTELARQRIEQLKKKGLTRSQQKLQTDNQVSDKEQPELVEQPPAPASTVVQHPLPERPPLPDPAPLDRIPGLFMTEQVAPAVNSAQATPGQDTALGSAAQPRTSQRKRPRASDFDEPIPVPKRTFSNGTNHVSSERLVIDISDDESIDGDDDLAMSTSRSNGPGISAAESLSQTEALVTDNLPHRPATSQIQSFSSTSVTPNNLKGSEQEDLRKKDLEIQAMHRRIAELEQRKKARLASRTQSPRAVEPSPSSDSADMPPVQGRAADINDKTLESLLAPLDAEGLRRMKFKIVRMQEIEAGIPSLDAEIQKSEAKLAELERLSVELAKGREGRRHLLEELNSLKSELNGVCLDEVNAALNRLEAKEELPVEVVQGMLRRLSIPGLERSDSTTYQTYDIAPGYEKEASNEPASASQMTPGTDVLVPDTSSQNVAPLTQENLSSEPTPDVSNNAGATNADLNEIADGSSDTSMSDDSSSSMDQSSDSSDSSPSEDDEEMSDAHAPSRPSHVPEDGTGATVADMPNGSHAENEPISENPPNIPPSQTDIAYSAGEEPVAESKTQVSRESSVSEAYEPPEPNESASSSGSSYSPAPSPEFPNPAGQVHSSASPEDPSQEAGEPLTAKAQELDSQQPSHYHQIGPLDNARTPEDGQRKFSTYSSPLKLFKAYRYHPNYSDNVSGGYRSLTYSHNIDPLKHLCPFESSGGICNDRSCEYQHFRDMALSDDKILVQMGSLREGKTPEECDKYVAGLKETINDMRRDKVKDMNTVASEIAAYRRRFLQDPTRVLAL
ncbi:hypothetical protein BJX61DRAFT_527272 [Aspergillus egyptiacus]|nr:hypothetical protein BJX61DRAFT_527272 [Aspergillus egyptiacus]